MWNSEQEAQDAPAKPVDKLSMALAEPASDVGTVDDQNGTVDNIQIKWWALALPILVLMVIIAAHFLNAPASTVADGENSRWDDPALPEESTSSRRSPDKSPNSAFVSSIAYSESRALAFINDQMVPEGGVVDGVTVFKIHQDSVEFEKNGRRWTQRVGE